MHNPGYAVRRDSVEASPFHNRRYTRDDNVEVVPFDDRHHVYDIIGENPVSNPEGNNTREQQDHENYSTVYEDRGVSLGIQMEYSGRLGDDSLIVNTNTRSVRPKTRSVIPKTRSVRPKTRSVIPKTRRVTCKPSVTHSRPTNRSRSVVVHRINTTSSFISQDRHGDDEAMQDDGGPKPGYIENVSFPPSYDDCQDNDTSGLSDSGEYQVTEPGWLPDCWEYIEGEAVWSPTYEEYPAEEQPVLSDDYAECEDTVEFLPSDVSEGSFQFSRRNFQHNPMSLRVPNDRMNFHRGSNLSSTMPRGNAPSIPRLNLPTTPQMVNPLPPLQAGNTPPHLSAENTPSTLSAESTPPPLPAWNPSSSIPTWNPSSAIPAWNPSSAIPAGNSAPVTPRIGVRRITVSSHVTATNIHPRGQNTIYPQRPYSTDFLNAHISPNYYINYQKNKNKNATGFSICFVLSMGLFVILGFLSLVCLWFVNYIRQYPTTITDICLPRSNLSNHIIGNDKSKIEIIDLENLDCALIVRHVYVYTNDDIDKTVCKYNCSYDQFNNSTQSRRSIQFLSTLNKNAYFKLVESDIGYLGNMNQSDIITIMFVSSLIRRGNDTYNQQLSLAICHKKLGRNEICPPIKFAPAPFLDSTIKTETENYAVIARVRLEDLPSFSKYLMKWESFNINNDTYTQNKMDCMSIIVGVEDYLNK